MFQSHFNHYQVALQEISILVKRRDHYYCKAC